MRREKGCLQFFSFSFIFEWVFDVLDRYRYAMYTNCTITNSTLSVEGTGDYFGKEKV